jgi:8-oxo-dGTP pyrophosphatase MutT (NUDIX family)
MDANRITGTPLVLPLDRKIRQEAPVQTNISVNTVCKAFADKLLVATAHPPNAKVSESVKVRRQNNKPRAPNSLGSDVPRCMRYNCSQKSKRDYNTCFCSEECQDIVFENSHSAAIVLIGLGPLEHRESSSPEAKGDRTPYSIILKGRRKDLKSNEEWEAPGGVRERGLSETAIGCAIRECVEETGMVIKVDKMAKYLLRCPMVAMSIKSGTRFSGIYHLAILAHISGFSDLNMHIAWISRMDRYTKDEVDKSGRPVVRSDCVDMEYSAALDLPALWMATTKFRSSGHPRKSAKILRATVEDNRGSPASRLASPTQQGPLDSLDPLRGQEVILCYRDYWSMSRIYDRGLIETVMAMPTLEQLGIWDQIFIL